MRDLLRTAGKTVPRATKALKEACAYLVEEYAEEDAVGTGARMRSRARSTPEQGASDASGGPETGEKGVSARVKKRKGKERPKGRAKAGTGARRWDRGAKDRRAPVRERR